MRFKLLEYTIDKSGKYIDKYGTAHSNVRQAIKMDKDWDNEIKKEQNPKQSKLKNDLTKKRAQNRDMTINGSIFTDDGKEEFDNAPSIKDKCNVLLSKSQLRFKSKSKVFIDEVLVKSIQTNGDIISKNRYLLFIYILSDSPVLKGSPKVDVSKNKHLFDITSNFNLVKNEKVLNGFAVTELYDMNYQDFYYATNILLTLNIARLYDKYGFDDDTAEEALDEILIDGKHILPAGRNEQDENVKCIWNVVKKYTQKFQKTNVNNKKTQKPITKELENQIKGNKQVQQALSKANIDIRKVEILVNESITKKE